MVYLGQQAYSCNFGCCSKKNKIHQSVQKLAVSIIALAILFGDARPVMGQAFFEPKLDEFGNCYTTDPFINTTGATSSATPFGTSSLALTEASTTQLLTIAARRREEKTRTCPSELDLVDGQCIPPRVETVAVQEPSPPPKAPTSAAPPKQVSPPASVAPSRPYLPSAKDIEPDSFGEEMILFDKGVWIEGFYDYEERSNIPDGEGDTFDRESRSAGFVAGMDKTIRLNSASGVQLGALAGYNRTRQEFDGIDTPRIETVETEFAFPLRDQGDGFTDAIVFDPLDGNVPGTIKTATIPVQHEISIVSLKQTTDGASIGTYGSYFSDGFSIDTVIKADFLSLRRVTEESERFPTAFSELQVQQNTDGDNTDGNRIQELQHVGCFKVSQEAFDRGPTLDDVQRFDNSGEGVVFEDFISRPLPTSRQTTDYETYVIASNVQYRFDQPNGTWIEPTAGFRFTYADFDDDARSLGLQDGHVLRLQGGIRAGITKLMDADSDKPFVWSGSISGIVYSDILIDGFTDTSQGLSPVAVQDDEGKLRFEGTIRNELNMLDGLSLYSEVSGRVGEDLWGIGGKLGFRQEW